MFLVAQLPEGAESGLVQVLDLDMANQPAGVYTAGLVADGINLGTIKFEVIK